MANARDLRKRRKSAQNTRKITKTMELVASAKLKKAQQAAEASRPYAEGLSNLVAQLSADAEGTAHPLMARRSPKTVALLLACSDRGLCGAFNSNLIRKAIERYKEHVAAGRTVEVVCLGKKAVSTLRFAKITVAGSHNRLMDAPKYAASTAVIQPYMDRFAAGQVDLVEVVYSRYLSAVRQVPDCIGVLPAGGTAKSAGHSKGVDYMYHPGAAQILEKLIPETVKTAFYSTLLQTAAGEHAARRMAMKNATDAAGDLIKGLTRDYNRARQGKITQEIAEIVGAVEAMK